MKLHEHEHAIVLVIAIAWVRHCDSFSDPEDYFLLGPLDSGFNSRTLPLSDAEDLLGGQKHVSPVDIVIMIIYFSDWAPLEIGLWYINCVDDISGLLCSSLALPDTPRWQVRGDFPVPFPTFFVTSLEDLGR